MAQSLSFDVMARDRASKVFDNVGRSALRTESTFAKVSKTAARLGKIAAVGLAGGVVAAGFAMKGFVDDAEESRKISRLTGAAIKSTGGAAKVTARQIGDLATAISNKTAVDDEAIQSASNLLLTFTNVRNEVGKSNKIFDRATQAAVDMAVALGTEPRKAAIQLGKALNDPVKGITALSKAGVSFTAQQKAQIKTLVESGKTLEAQKIILDELGTEFGGAAKAAASPMQRLQVIADNFGETLGGVLLPYVDKAADSLGDRLPGAADKLVRVAETKVIPAFKDLGGWVKDNQETFEDLGSAVKDFVPVVVNGASQAVRAVSPLVSIVADLARVTGDMPIAAQTAGLSMIGMGLAANRMAPHMQGATKGFRDVAAGLALVASAPSYGETRLNAMRSALGGFGGPRGVGTAFRKSLSSAMGVVGGPWGLALTVGVGALAAFATKHQQAKAEIAAMAETLDEETLAITRGTRAFVVRKLEEEGVLKRAREMGLSLNDVTDAALGNATAQGRVNAQLNTYAAAQGAANTVGGRAGQVTNQTRLKVDQFRESIGGANSALAAARDKAARFSEALNGIKSKTVRITAIVGVNVKGANVNSSGQVYLQTVKGRQLIRDGGYVSGGRVRRFDTGGLVRGPGTGRSDSIAARISNGEFVVNAASTRRNLATLHAINNGNGPVGAAPVPTIHIEHLEVQAAPGERAETSLPRSLRSLAWQLT